MQAPRFGADILDRLALLRALSPWANGQVAKARLFLWYEH